MRVVYYNPSFYGNGGASTHAQGLARGLESAGHEVLVLPSGELGGVLGMHMRRGRAAPDSLMAVVRTLRGLARAGRMLASCLRRIGEFKPDVLIVRRAPYDFTCDALVRTGDYAKVAEVNVVGSVEAKIHWGHRYDLAEVRRERRYLSACDRVCCVTEEVKVQVESLGVPTNKLCVVPNGVDTDKFFIGVEPDPHVATICTGASHVVGYCASVTPLHDLRTAVAAMRVVAEHDLGMLRFLFVGPTIEDIRQAGADSAFLDQCVVLGHVSHQRVPALMACMDVGCVALRNNYGSPLKIREFLAMGVPIAVSAVGSGSTIVAELGAGVLVSPEDPDALAEAIRTLLDDADLRRDISRRGADWAANHSDWKHAASRMLVDL